MRGGQQFQVSINTTPMVKRLIIINTVIWVFLILIVQQYFLQEPFFFKYFGLIPADIIFNFFLWQPLTYMFIHADNIFHVMFNMLVLWMFGSELEGRWGSRFFLLYYLVCGIGAGTIYTFCTLIYYLFTTDVAPLMSPVIGASGATFGLVLAYGIIFGERQVLFMFIFPMKAKYFALLLGIIELLSLLSSGFGSEVSNLAHLGGIVSGFLFLLGYTRYKNRRVRKRTKSHGRKLKLVVDNERKDEDGPDKSPKYWN